MTSFSLSLFRIGDSWFLLKQLRYAVLLIFLVAAICCPKPDPISMTLFAMPMLALYFLAMLVAYVAHSSKRIQ